MDFIYRTWPFLGLPLGVALASKAVVESKPSFSSLDATVPPRSSSLLRWLRTRDVAFWLQIALPIYMIHQFEEHGYDVFGRRYYFHEAFCKTFVGLDSTLQRPCVSFLVFRRGQNIICIRKLTILIPSREARILNPVL